jgi:leader peptidase (prepilin peptidase)/N-methyltransferase
MVSWIAIGLLGLITGSFLNAVIHRLPRGISLLDPKRSFCPGCGKTIPWHENLPVASWVLLRGRCSVCAMPIAIRYPLVEILTTGLYLCAWGRFGLPQAPAVWLFLSLIVAATFIDFDHLIIPDEITKGGVVAGLLCSLLLPEVLGADLWWQGLLLSLMGATFGFFLLFGVVELGKIAFGRRRIRPDDPTLLEITGKDTDPILVFGEERIPLADLFYREKDRVDASCAWLEIDGGRLEGGKLVIDPHGIIYGSRFWAYEGISELMPLRAEVTMISLPREAMGFGDVKFLACIGAFLGWKGVLFSLFAGSITGALIGVAMMAATQGRSGGRIPFGPYLALGALLWVFFGPQLLDLYANWVTGGGFFLLPRHPTL